MNLRIRKVDGKSIAGECIIIDVLKDCDLNEFILFDTTYDEEGVVSNKHRHSFFFPKINAKKDEIILIYTKEGKDIMPSKDLPFPTPYVLYWGLDTCVWNNDKDNTLLVHVDDCIGKIV